MKNDADDGKPRADQPGAAPDRSGKVSHPGMMGDGTMEQDLNEPGDPAARVTREDVEEAFGQKGGKDDRKPR